MLSQATAAAAVQPGVWLEAVYYLHVGNHVVLPRELLVAHGARVVLDVGLVRGNVVSAKVAYVGVGAMANGATINVALFHAKVANRALASLALHLEGALKVTLTDIRLPRDKIEYGTAQAVLGQLVVLRLRVGVLLLLLMMMLLVERFTLITGGVAVLLAKALLEVYAYLTR